MFDASQIGFRLVTMADLPLIHHWLNHTPAVMEFYADGEETPYEAVVAKYGPRIRRESPTTPYLMLYGDTPIGAIQTYLWRDYAEEAQYFHLSDEAAGVDLFIGHPDYLHRGLGRAVLHAFLREIVFADRRVDSCVIIAEVRNESGLKFYKKAGFEFQRVVESPHEPCPVWVLYMKRTGLIPSRAEYLTAPLRREEQRPPVFDAELPPEVTALTGAVQKVTLPEQGVCNLLLQVHAERGAFALKVAQGEYRSQELWAEHAAMRALAGGQVAVPPPLLFVRQGDRAFQLRTYVPGVPMNNVMGTAERPRAIAALGRSLAAIHSAPVAPAFTWNEWVDRSLELAARNMAAGVIDLEEDFSPDRPPAAVLEWLHAHRPAGGPVCLLHGDYRPKNLLWQNGEVTAVIDWAFVDVGDPYYDLSIVRWYMRDEAEWQQFLTEYGLCELDEERFAFCMQLHKFLNV